MRARSLLVSLLGISLASTVLLEGGARSAPGTAPEGSAPATAPTPAAPAAGRSAELEAAVRSLVNDRALKVARRSASSSWTARRGNVLAQSGEHVVLNPASNAKLYTAAAALAHPARVPQVPDDVQRHDQGRRVPRASSSAATAIRRSAPRISGRWSRSSKAHGVRRVEGDIVVDQTLLRRADDAARVRAAAERVGRVPRARERRRAEREHAITMTVRPTPAGQPASVIVRSAGLRRRRRHREDVRRRRRHASASTLAPTGEGGLLRRRSRARVGADSRSFATRGASTIRSSSPATR